MEPKFSLSCELRVALLQVPLELPVEVLGEQ